jgi:hypothetical protein
MRQLFCHMNSLCLNDAIFGLPNLFPFVIVSFVSSIAENVAVYSVLSALLARSLYLMPQSLASCIPHATFPFQLTSPHAPLSGRVCDDCWGQVHGSPTPRTSDLIHSVPILVSKLPFSSASSSIASWLLTPAKGLAPILRRRFLCPMPSVLSLGSTSRRMRGCCRKP